MSTAAIFFNFLWALILVAGLAYVAARLLRRAGFGSHSPSHYIQQIDFLPLGPKRGIAIIQVVDKTLCVGITDAHIDLLCELDADALARQGPPAAPTTPFPLSRRGFAEEVWRRLHTPPGGPR
ncbi:MAG: flagellar biosynthetic protein FliO [Firmicutes bacterium]|nr:flagellar biosynthetic protein FliO [Alicyclobacillaceae bacterium]MCL6497304.1 flagellar biosynthetic protein FliO [Bacillota bacterium]